MNFKFIPRPTQTNIVIDGMLVGCIAPAEERAYFRVCLAVDAPIKWKWAVLKKTFKKEVDAKRFLILNIDSLLKHFPLYPISK